MNKEKLWIIIICISILIGSIFVFLYIKNNEVKDDNILLNDTIENNKNIMQNIDENKEVENMNSFDTISAEDAKLLMDNETGYIILDVRTQSEYDEGHINNAILIPNETISEDVKEILKDKNQLILVYCRSGNRSRQAAEKLSNLGYTNIKDFGGIIDWKYEVVK